MPVKSSAAEISFAKVLIVVTLLTWSATRLATAESIPEGVIRSLNALDTLNVTHNSISTKRYLKSTTAMTTSVHTNNLELEERFSFSGLAVKLKPVLSKIIQKVQVLWWRLRWKSSDDVFKLLKLDQAKENLLADSAFPKWVAFVKSSSKKSSEVAMVETLSKYYKGDALAKILVEVAKIESTKPFAEKLTEFASWITTKKTATDVFKLLQLDQTKDKLFVTPAFFRWVAFVTVSSKEKSPNAAIKSMFKTLSDHYKDDDLALAEVLVAGTKIDSTKFIAQKLQEAQFASWETRKKTATDVFKLLKLDKTPRYPFETPIFSIWTTYVTRFGKDDLIEVIYDTFETVFQPSYVTYMVAAATKKSNKLVLKLGRIQFEHWQHKKVKPEKLKKMLPISIDADIELIEDISQNYAKFLEEAKKTESQVS